MTQRSCLPSIKRCCLRACRNPACSESFERTRSYTLTNPSTPQSATNNDIQVAFLSSKLLPHPSSMSTLQTLPSELLELIIEYLVIKIGIYRAVLLRTVCRSFDTAIIYAICTSQVIDMEDPATPDMANKMHPKLRGKIILKKSKHLSKESKGYVRAVAQVNQALDNLLGGIDEERHRAIAEAVYAKDCYTPAPKKSIMEERNLLSGAAIIGDLDLIKSLLERKDPCDINGTTPSFPNALTCAAANGHLEIVRYLLDHHGARPDVESSYWYVSASWKNLSQPDQNPFESSYVSTMYQRRLSPVRAAILGGHTEIVHLLLQSHPHQMPADSLEFLRALLAAVRVGRYDFVQLLFEASSYLTLERHGKEMLCEAVRGDQKDMVERLLDLGVDVNSMPNFLTEESVSVLGAVSIAASLGNISMVRYLISRGADINRTFRGEWCLPIAVAALRGQEEILKLFLDHGANSEIALYAAALGSQPRIVGYLLNRYSELCRIDTLRQALSKAVAESSLECITILVEAGAPLNCRDPPILRAKRLGLPWVVAHLIELGARDIGCYDREVRKWGNTVRGVRASERTWEWVGRY